MTWTEMLPIDAHLPLIVDTIANNPVTIVEAEPGAGKTTRIPQAIAELLGERTHLVIPRRSAVPPIGERIAAEMGTTPGDKVGWVLAREASVRGPNTRVILQVTQSMVNSIIESGQLPEGVLIIDEAHERSIPIDLLLGLVKGLLPHSPRAKVVVTSATIDTEKFSKFFNDAPVIKVEGKCYPVEVRPYELSIDEHHSDGAGRAAIEELEAFAKSGGYISVAEGTANGGTIGVLLPGEDDIRTQAAAIAAAVRRYPGIPAEIMTLVGQSSAEDSRAIDQPVPEGSLRFALGTEVLRSSRTIRDCIVVIDSLQVKRRVCDENGVGHLKKISVSRAEADQGKGRAGRTANGAYRPVVLKDEFDKLVPYPIPAMVREPIASVVLQIAYCGLDARFFELPDQPASGTIDAAVTRLQRLGLLDEHGVITDIGRKIVNLPVDPDHGMALMAAHDLDVLSETIIAVAVLQQGNIFSTDKDDQRLAVGASAVREIMARLTWDKDVNEWIAAEEPQDPKTVAVDFGNLPSWIKPKEVKLARNAKATPPALWDVDCTEVHFPHKQRAEWLAGLARIRWADDTLNDFAAAVRAWREYVAMSRLLSGSDLRDWCRGYGIHHRRAQLTTDMVEQLCFEFKVAFADLCQHRKFRSINLTMALLAGLFDNLGANTADLKPRNPRYESRVGQYTLLYNSAAHGTTPLVLAGGVRKTKKGDRIAELAARVEPDWLGHLLPHLCEVKVVDDDEQGYFNGVLVMIRPPAPPESVSPPVSPPVSSTDTYVQPEASTPQQHTDTSCAAVQPVADTVADSDPYPDRLQVLARVMKQGRIAKQIAALYPVVEEHMPESIERHRLLAMMRQRIEAPTVLDDHWTEQALCVLALAKLRVPVTPPKEGKKNKKKDR